MSEQIHTIRIEAPALEEGASEAIAELGPTLIQETIISGYISLGMSFVFFLVCAGLIAMTIAAAKTASEDNDEGIFILSVLIGFIALIMTIPAFTTLYNGLLAIWAPHTAILSSIL